MKTEQIKEIIKKYIIVISGSVFGMIGGFLYWKYIGCLSGTCPLTSNPWIMLVYGGLAGGTLSGIAKDMFRKSKLKKVEIK